MTSLVSSSFCILLAHGLLYSTVISTLTCPQKHGADPSDVNGRLNALVSVKKEYSYDDTSTKYIYKWTICKINADDTVAIEQSGKDLKHSIDLGEYDGAVVVGGKDWFMITYPNGKAYGSHCGKQRRKSSVMVTCDPDVTIGTLKIIEEYKYTDNASDECYYLFELNNKAACTIKKPTVASLSPGSVLLIVVLIVVGVYLVLGFLYQRFVAGAKGLEQIPNYELWTSFGGLQADGCNFICRCREVKQRPRYKPVEDALSDDINADLDDDTLLPAV